MFIVGKSAVVKGSTNPKWEEEFFTLKLPVDLDILESTVLMVEVWNMSRTGRGDFLGIKYHFDFYFWISIFIFVHFNCIYNTYRYDGV